jgi:protein phosphatase
VKITAAGQSDVGRVREQNEDSYLVSVELGLFVVADGMGGHLGGQMASKLAVETVLEVVQNNLSLIADGAAVTPLESSPVPRILAEAIRRACSTIYDRAQANPALAGMGTTCTALVVRGERGFVGHVGDSRCYLQRGDRVIQITDDHSLVNDQIKHGLITPEQARASRLKNIITRSVGFEPDVAVDTFAFPIETGDRFLICSDGLTSFVSDAELGGALATMPVGEVPGQMIQLANARGGEDNTTVITLCGLRED